MQPGAGTPATILGLFSPGIVARGFTQAVKIAQPAAGAGFTYRIDSTWQERVVGFTFQWVTDATGASRRILVDYQDGDANTLIEAHGEGAPAVSTTSIISAYIGAYPGVSSASTKFSVPLPDLILPGGWQISVTATAGFGVGDQISGINLVTQRFPTGPTGYPLGPQDQADLLATIGG